MTSHASLLTEKTPKRDSLASPEKYTAPEVDLSELTPVDRLHKSNSSLIVQARWQHKDCVLKIYHYREKRRTDPVHREVDPYLCESRAYCRLKAFGLCEQGHIPDFYGLVKDIDPKTESWESYLDGFVEDPVRPNAVLMEFIPNLQTFEFETFTTERADQLRTTMTEIHKAGVCFGDLYPRNVKVQEETNRALFIDFDHAQTLPPNSRKKRTMERIRKWMRSEEAVLNETLVELAGDRKRGKIWWSWWWHYEVFDPPGWTKEDEAARLAAIQESKSVDPVQQRGACDDHDLSEEANASKKQKTAGTLDVDEITSLADEHNKGAQENSHPLSAPAF